MRPKWLYYACANLGVLSVFLLMDRRAFSTGVLLLCITASIIAVNLTFWFSLRFWSQQIRAEHQAAKSPHLPAGAKARAVLWMGLAMVGLGIAGILLSVSTSSTKGISAPDFASGAFGVFWGGFIALNARKKLKTSVLLEPPNDGAKPCAPDAQ